MKKRQKNVFTQTCIFFYIGADRRSVFFGGSSSSELNTSESENSKTPDVCKFFGSTNTLLPARHLIFFL